MKFPTDMVDWSVQKNNRRRFQRIPFRQRFECQYVFDSELSDVCMVESENISQAGLLVTMERPIPLGSVVTFAISNEVLRPIFDVRRLQSYIEIQIGAHVYVKLCGKVVRIEPASQKYRVAIHLIVKS